MNKNKSVRNKLENPFLKANFFSRLNFLYVRYVIKKFLKQQINENDLYDTLPELKSETLGKKFEKLGMKYGRKNTSFSILRILFMVFGKRLMIIHFILICSNLLKTFLEPFLIANMLSNFTSHANGDTFKNSLASTIALYIFFVLYSLLQCYCMLLTNQLSLQVAVALSSLIYRKLLRVKDTCKVSGSLGEGGNVVTLITKDVFMFESIINVLGGCLCFVLTFAFSLNLVYRRVGMVGMSCFVVVFFVLILKIIISNLLHTKRIKVDVNTARRLEILREAISAIRTVKMLSWEEHFIRKIEAARKIEIRSILILYILRFFIWFLGLVCISAPFYVFLILYLYIFHISNIIDLIYVMVVLKVLRVYLMNILPTGIAGLAEMFAAVRRINNFLSLDEVQYKITNENDLAEIFLNNVNLKIGSLRLNNISLHLERKGIVLVTGPLGSGKSTLLRSILGEVSLNDHCSINGKLSYASQNPWIFPSTIKQNIIFGEDFDEKRYKNVLEICNLSYDLQQFHQKDETLLIDGGANLSKGQQARINLARAIYRKANIYLLDDCFSALDRKVGDTVFKNCVAFLKEAIVLIVIQNPNHLFSCVPNMRIISIKNEKVRLINRNSSELEFTHRSVICNNKIDDIKNIEEKVYNLNKEEKVYNLDTFVDSEESDKLLKHSPDVNIYYEDTKSGTISITTLRKYLNFCGGFSLFIVLITIFSIFEMCSVLSQKVLMYWITSEEKLAVIDSSNFSNFSQHEQYNEALEKRNMYFITYNITFFFYIVIGVLTSIMHFCSASKASIRIHKLMVQKVIRAKLKFFDTHLLGNILNRFSKDVYNLDENIPQYFFQLIFFGMEVLGSMILVAVSNWILLITVLLISFVGFIMMKYIFLPISSSLKRLESAVHSPMIGHLNATIEGLATIRVHGNEDLLKAEFDNYQDKFSSANFTIITISKAFGFFILLLFCLMQIVVLSYFYLGDNVTAAEIGVIVATSGRLYGNINILDRHLIEFLAVMTSAERAFNYTEIETENYKDIELDNCPNEGHIVFDNVSLTYPTNPHPILKEVNLKIKANAKIGIIGRTGSGKSSLIASLYNFYPIEGRILIDYVDVKHLSLNYRSKIGIIGQSPILFSGTIRDNLDPCYQFTDDVLWKALKTVKLSFNLDDNIVNLNLSNGQKQLICLARILLKKKKIVILDEATSDLDADTESYICEIIKESFKECTVLVITHKMEILKNLDEIVSVKDGNIYNLDINDTYK